MTATALPGTIMVEVMGPTDLAGVSFTVPLGLFDLPELGQVGIGGTPERLLLQIYATGQVFTLSTRELCAAVARMAAEAAARARGRS